METAALFSLLNVEPGQALALLTVGFFSGLASRFVGSDGALLLPALLMSMGIPGLTAISSTIAQRVPKLLIGTIHRSKLGQVNRGLGVRLVLWAAAGVLGGVVFQHLVQTRVGVAASNLCLSVAMITVMVWLGGRAVRRVMGHTSSVPQQPGTNRRPPSPSSPHFSAVQLARIGLSNGLATAAVAVGGVVAVPAMVRWLNIPVLVASGTDLLVSAWSSLIGVLVLYALGHLHPGITLLLLLGSLLGIQLSAVSRARLSPRTVRLVLGLAMGIILISQLLVLPGYLDHLNY
ncbi:MAG: sulfite exporter TauE/SafE family protein [Magnetococcales bacterium]|nr:sulfite exporter TauE/SafE family protein [Magnetococcales bacterium]